MKRVVVTGIGAITPLGLNMEETWQNLIAGKSGVDYITLFDASNFPVKIAAEVKGFDPLNYLDKKEARRMDRFTQFVIAAAQQARESAQLKKGFEEEAGVLVGSGIGGLSTLIQQHKILLERGADRVSPFLSFMMIPDIASGQIAIRFGLKRVNFCITSSCCSSSDALGIAAELIHHGEAKVMFVGGCEAVINSIGIAAFAASRALSRRNDNPKEASRPFDALRDGFVMGEGATVLILEDLDYALRRDAPILAELIGYGATSDAYHVTEPEPSGEGAVRAMKKALSSANLKPEDIDYINAHGTSTPLNDKTETLALKKVFSEYAYKVPVSSTKSMLGHLLGAAGTTEAAIAIYTLLTGIIPPTINLTNPDPECDLDYVPNKARKKEVKIAMSNTFGFGGHNSVLIFKRWEG